MTVSSVQHPDSVGDALSKCGLGACALVLAFLAAGCATFQPPTTADKALRRLQPHEYPLFTDDMPADTFEQAVGASLEYLRRLDPQTAFQFGPDRFTAAHLIDTLEAFGSLLRSGPSAETLQRAVKRDYRVYRSVGSDGKGHVLFTGYYEPVIAGCLAPTAQCRYPVYRRPDDLVRIDLGLFAPKYAGESLAGRYTGQTVVPYFTRRQIDVEGRLAYRDLELAWVPDPLDLFFLHVQGSGRLLLDDGRVFHVHYDGTNGHPYRSIGKLLMDEGRVPSDEMSMQRIKDYLRANPHLMERILSHNPSYVFFRFAERGPLGCLDVPLTGGRSVATDKRLFPMAAPAFIVSRKPLLDARGTISRWTGFGRFVLNQDTGGVIKGPGRVDLFWGGGPFAETAAGHMREEGALYFLVLKPG